MIAQCVFAYVQSKTHTMLRSLPSALRAATFPKGEGFFIQKKSRTVRAAMVNPTRSANRAAGTV